MTVEDHRKALDATDALHDLLADMLDRLDQLEEQFAQHDHRVQAGDDEDA